MKQESKQRCRVLVFYFQISGGNNFKEMGPFFSLQQLFQRNNKRTIFCWRLQKLKLWWILFVYVNTLCVFVCARVCTGAFTGHPPAARPSKGDHAASGGGAGHPPKSDTVTAAAGPCCRQAGTHSAGQNHNRAWASAQQNTHTAENEENVCLHLQVPPPPAPTHHPTVIVPAPALTQHSHHHVTVVTVSPSVYTSTMSTSRQNLDTIVQVSGLNVSKLAD